MNVRMQNNNKLENCTKIKELFVTHCDTHGYFFNTSGKRANKPNRLVCSKPEPDESAVFSVLQFGAIIPPLSPWKGVKRYIPGYCYQGMELIGPVELERPDHIANLDLDQQADEVNRTLDRSLKALIGDRKDPVLLFSGGVDSGLIASRLALLGYRDTLLLNYSFGEEDSESQLAEAMSNKLGLQFKRFLRQRDLSDCLIKPGRVYSQPFGDYATVNASDFAHSVVNHLAGRKCLILSGVGADGLFGLPWKIKWWNRVMRIPALLRKVGSLFYGSTLWHRSGKIEYLFRHSLNMPILSAMLAQNPLAGTLYNDTNRKPVDTLLYDLTRGWSGNSSMQHFIATVMLLSQANIFAYKNQSILEIAGHEVAYPFMDSDMLSLGLAAIPYWGMNMRKAPLKRSLARHIPPYMVYRPKSGFTDPRNKTFYDAEFIGYLRAAAEETSPVAFILNRKLVLKACDLLSRGNKMPVSTLYCLWAITFVDRWYRSSYEDVIRKTKVKISDDV